MFLETLATCGIIHNFWAKKEKEEKRKIENFVSDTPIHLEITEDGVHSLRRTFHYLNPKVEKHNNIGEIYWSKVDEQYKIYLVDDYHQNFKNSIFLFDPRDNPENYTVRLTGSIGVIRFRYKALEYNGMKDIPNVSFI